MNELDAFVIELAKIMKPQKLTQAESKRLQQLWNQLQKYRRQDGSYEYPFGFPYAEYRALAFKNDPQSIVEIIKRDI